MDRERSESTTTLLRVLHYIFIKEPVTHIKFFKVFVRAFRWAVIITLVFEGSFFGESTLSIFIVIFLLSYVREILRFGINRVKRSYRKEKLASANYRAERATREEEQRRNHEEKQRFDSIHDVFKVDIHKRYAILNKDGAFKLVDQKADHKFFGTEWITKEVIFKSYSYEDVLMYYRRTIKSKKINT